MADVPGNIVDAGTFKGVSTIQMAHFLQIYQPHGKAKVVSFDTFEAKFPRARKDEAASVERHGKLFEETAYVQIGEAVERLGLTSRVELIKGDITETLPTYLAERPGFRISLLHCDLDVYAATKSLLETAWPRVVMGGLVVFDQYAVDAWGESDAADEFLAGLDNPPQLKMFERTPTPTAYIVKDRP
ncbi:MAG: TylF/MycF/NovP-related O-methyltransferase [Pseudomonadota bacterium]|nr:TylF/MycF/NovP-related O-methyltransferase [Pseudomonadota bacterium]